MVDLETVTERILEDETVNIDGKRWLHCEFRRCRIVVDTGGFELHGCSFHECQLAIQGRASNVISLIELFFPGKMPIRGPRPKPGASPS